MLISQGVTGLPVIDRDGNLSGIVTEKDILTLLNNPNIDHVTAGHLKTVNTICFDENDGLEVINECLQKNAFRRVPILSHGKLVGIISRTDVMKAILRGRCK